MDKYTKLICIKDFHSFRKNSTAFKLKSDNDKYGVTTLYTSDTLDNDSLSMLTSRVRKYFLPIEEYRKLRLVKILHSHEVGK